MAHEPISSERRWKTYLKAAVFLGPPLLIWAVLAVFVVPKVKQLCADAGAGAFTIFTVMDFIQENWWILAGVVMALLGLLEWRSGLWGRWRRWAIGAGVFLINTGVIVGIANLLVVMTIVGAMLSAPR